MKAIAPPAIIIVGILVTVLGATGLPVAYNRLEQAELINIPEDNPFAYGIEKAGEAIERAFTIDKEVYDEEIEKERYEEWKKYKDKPICKQVPPPEVCISPPVRRK